MLMLFMSVALITQPAAIDPQAYVDLLIDGEIDPIEFDYGVVRFPLDDLDREAEWTRIQTHLTSLGTLINEPTEERSSEGLICETTAIYRNRVVAEAATNYEEYRFALDEALNWYQEYKQDSANELAVELEGDIDPVVEEILERVYWDQAWRHAFSAFWGVEANGANADTIKSIMAMVEMCRVDIDNKVFVESFLDQYGWPRISEYGEEADRGLWLMLQHADLDLQEAWLPELERLWPEGETNPRNYAMLYDRVMMRTDRPQRYGSQYSCVDGGMYEMYETEDAGNVDERRLAMGMNTVEENGARFRDLSCGR